MTSRMFAASIVLLGIGAMVAPVETSARSGGVIAVRSLSAGGVVRPSVAVPFFAHASFPHGMPGAFPARIRGFQMSRFGDHRDPGFPLPNVPSYYPSEYAIPYGEPPYGYRPVENFSERSRPVVTYQPGCR